MFTMWGNISTESTYQTNFNLGFSNNTSDVLIHLSQWQYWWWFWFAFVWVLYYFIVARTVRHRLLKFRPRIVTSFRPHGKWGDLLTCLIPVSWCVNIIINSSFILKMVEWQNEASLFTIRIRGRQWYWVYKFELKTFTDILSAPKNVGHNHWQLSTPGDLQLADDYLHVLQMRSQNKWIKNYWNDILKKHGKIKKNHTVSSQEKFKFDYSNLNEKIVFLNKLNNNLLAQNLVESKNNLNELFTTFVNENNFDNKIIQNNNLTYFIRLKNKRFNLENIELNNNFNLFNTLSDENYIYFFKNLNNFKQKTLNVLTKKFWFNEIFQNTNSSVLRFTDFLENTRNIKRSQGAITPLRIIKNPFNEKYNFNEVSFNDNIELFKFRFNDNNVAYTNKVTPGSIYLTLKQKKYKYQKNVRFKSRIVTDFETNKKLTKKWSPVLTNNAIFEDNTENATQQYRLMRKNKNRQEVFPVHLNRRLLRTKRTLVLPAHVNITAITNSYDVVHSWFIPGLGLKIDCIPGRATHHTLFIDNVGFYYGQCAEICGRYHHHMPIRICALPFEHFLVWWHSFGLPKLLFTNSQKKYSTNYAFRKYVW